MKKESMGTQNGSQIYKPKNIWNGCPSNEYKRIIGTHNSIMSCKPIGISNGCPKLMKRQRMSTYNGFQIYKAKNSWNVWL